MGRTMAASAASFSPMIQELNQERLRIYERNLEIRDQVSNFILWGFRVRKLGNCGSLIAGGYNFAVFTLYFRRVGVCLS